ncbi:Bromodomain-containing protein, partial [Fragilariopsis cylindrus CCMP1102]
YFAIIQGKPMDFGTIKKKVLQNKYATLGSFVSDARLLCDNAMLYNPPDSIYWKTAREISD